MINDQYQSPMIGALMGMQSQQRRPYDYLTRFMPQGQQGGQSIGQQPMTPPAATGIVPPGGGGFGNMQHGGGLQMGGASRGSAAAGPQANMQDSPLIQAFLQMMQMQGMTGPQRPRKF